MITEIFPAPVVPQWVMNRELSQEKIDVARLLQEAGISIAFNAAGTGITLELPSGREVDIVMPNGQSV